ncbi:lytic transglycosylase domain-containing protein [Marivita hallyeonensis]|uniref:Transglycosylase SLT domain-containing protein n=1 Tax=Marivita hallyeonensis TaxID=996342 RepID=A0A1M5X7J3_9RHOB|nr:lytic transglycosylase domain-containing protein [Marivita hallyeonensis]SHH95602.1 Transglycosylase SLT domain-containing protein [Marivita hallyeonensis]
MGRLTRGLILSVLLVAALGCTRSAEVNRAATIPLYPNETPQLRSQIEDAARRNDVPVSLVQRVVIRESTHRPGARNGPYYGLMQILPETARTMGFRGAPSELLDAETNLKYAVRYLRGAWLVSGGDEAEAVMWYARGYYYEAKRLGLLDETGVHGRKTWPE